MKTTAKFQTKPALGLDHPQALHAQVAVTTAVSAQPDANGLGSLNNPDEPVDELVFTARRKITLQCGQSSITLHPNGKIILRGDYILSAAEGTNRIVGGQVEIN